MLNAKTSSSCQCNESGGNSSQKPLQQSNTAAVTVTDLIQLVQIPLSQDVFFPVPFPPPGCPNHQDDYQAAREKLSLSYCTTAVGRQKEKGDILQWMRAALTSGVCAVWVQPKPDCAGLDLQPGGGRNVSAAFFHSDSSKRNCSPPIFFFTRFCGIFFFGGTVPWSFNSGCRENSLCLVLPCFF